MLDTNRMGDFCLSFEDAKALAHGNTTDGAMDYGLRTMEQEMHSVLGPASPRMMMTASNLMRSLPVAYAKPTPGSLGIDMDVLRICKYALIPYRGDSAMWSLVVLVSPGATHSRQY